MMNQKEVDEMARLTRELNVANEQVEILKMALVNIESRCASVDYHDSKILMMCNAAFGKATRVGHGKK